MRIGRPQRDPSKPIRKALLRASPLAIRRVLGALLGAPALNTPGGLFAWPIGQKYFPVRMRPIPHTAARKESGGHTGHRTGRGSVAPTVPALQRLPCARKPSVAQHGPLWSTCWGYPWVVLGPAIRGQYGGFQGFVYQGSSGQCTAAGGGFGYLALRPVCLVRGRRGTVSRFVE